ncbi:MAG: AAA family ATPase [Anaerolineales bacterium]|nr:AAA family ATPase [Anaerolineales bacterium]
MAKMIPSNPSTLRTGGERKVYQLLKNTFPPECIVRYEVLVGYRVSRPDFIIAHPQRGVCIVEVKDWGIDSILKITPDSVVVKGMQETPAPITLINPYKKCLTYIEDLREQMAGMISLLNEKNHLSVPVAFFLVFPNIKKGDFLVKGFEKAIPIEEVIFGDDLHNNEQVFFRRYQSALPLLSTPLSQEQQDDLTKALDPTIVIPKMTSSEGFIPIEEEIVHTDSRDLVMYNLNLEQEEIAKSLGEGPRLLRGIAGTGKTLILLYRAKLLAANDPNIKILILCWNTALANYMRQMFNKFRLEAKGSVKILHFSQFVRDFLEIQYDPFTKYDNDEEEISRLLDRHTISDREKYDVVYVDEAQDFRKEWINFVFSKIIRGEPKERDFIVAADDAQRIYRRRDFTWDSLDFKFTGRSRILRTIFRNSARIWIFSAFLLEEKAAYVRDQDEKGELIFANKGKYEPLVQKCKNIDEQLNFVVQTCHNMLREGFAARNVLVLYRHKTVPYKRSQIHIPMELQKRLGGIGITSDWIAEDAEAKRSFDWDADTVKTYLSHHKIAFLGNFG